MNTDATGLDGRQTEARRNAHDPSLGSDESALRRGRNGGRGAAGSGKRDRDPQMSDRVAIRDFFASGGRVLRDGDRITLNGEAPPALAQALRATILPAPDPA